MNTMAYNNRFTEHATKALKLANKAALKLGHGYIGSEHILLGLIHEGSGVAAKALATTGITGERVIGKIEELIGITSEKVDVSAIGMTPRTKRILELGWNEAQKMGHNYIGTEHLLMGILREGDSVPCAY